MIEEWAYAQFDDHKKGKSTIQAKCRSVWNWYDVHSWELPKSYIKRYNTPQEIKELKMTRKERALSNSKLIQEKSKRKVINTITGLYADEYKKVNGTWHIGKISKQLGMARNTVSKYLKQWEEEQR